MNRARTPDELLALLEADEANGYKQRGKQGITLLAELSPATRKHLLQVLIEERKAIGVGRQDWKKVRDTAPEVLESVRAETCNNVTVQP